MTHLVVGMPLATKILNDRRFYFSPFVISFFGAVGGLVFWLFSSLISASLAPFVFYYSFFLAFTAPLLVVWMVIYVICTAAILFFQISFVGKKHAQKQN